MVRRLFLFVPAALAALLLAAVLLTEGSGSQPGWSVSPLARTVTIACLVAAVVAGVLPKRGDVRLHASVALASFAMTSLGQSRMNEAPAIIYRAGCVAFVLVVIATLRAPHRWATAEAARLGHSPRAREAAPGASPDRPRGRAAALIVLAVAWAAVTALSVTQLPRASRAAERRVAHYFGGYEPPEDFVGFSSNLQLGSTRGMLKSAKVVMRIDGAPVDYLRGAVLDDYDARHQRWSSSLDEDRVDVPAAAAQGATATRIRMARSAPVAHGSEARWFLPGGACDLRAESGHVKVDRSGIAHPDPPTLANEIAFRAGPTCASGLSGPQQPGPLDLALTPQLRAKLEPIAARWTPGLTTDRAKLDAIALELGRFGYSLDVQRSRTVDAVVDLLTIHREGHCELFASALALLGRTQGIPTRVVAGYRVSEVNPITGLAVVRERNAHTWVEAWVDGRWDTWDPTPAIEMTTRSRSSGWDHGSEVLAWAWDRVATTFWEIGLARAGFGAGAIAIVLLVVRRFMQRGARGDAGERLVAVRPLPAFEVLAAALERAGWVRTASEPLERFATRVDGGGEPWSEDVARVLVRYAELRYGGIGEERTVAQRLEELARQIRPLA